MGKINTNNYRLRALLIQEYVKLSYGLRQCIFSLRALLIQEYVKLHQ